jgi:glycosyltransferase involved in cell wall biosynthesis
VPALKLALVVQRYGLGINGGAELHARYLAEHLSRHAQVRVLTTCAHDYITWRNEFAPGTDSVNGIPVERFPVVHERVADDFARRSHRVFGQPHSLHDELRWLESGGPFCPALVARVGHTADEFDFVLIFSIRYYIAYHAATAIADRAVLVPTAEREPALGLSLLPPVFRSVRAIMYNSFEERALIQGVAGNDAVPGVVVGVGSEVPDEVSADRARQKFGLTGPFVVYVGRIDSNKGFPELFEHFAYHLSRSGRPLTLVLLGTAVVPVPTSPHVRHLGFVDDRDKFDVIAASSALIVPSYYESLSMVALEAWALGKPVIANAKCDVLVGQCIRSGAGLYYQDVHEFSGVLDAVLADPTLADTLGRHGRTYFDAHYRWPVIEDAYLDMFERLSSEPARGVTSSRPGWFARHRRNKPPAAAVVDALPTGPIRSATDLGLL